MNFSKTAKKGFTLVEILIVLAILSVIATLLVVSFQSLKISGRDAKRVSDINSIRNALNMYYQKYNSYPTYVTTGEAFTVNSVTYLAVVPANPRPRTDNGCADKDYDYAQTDSGLSYSLTFCLGYNQGSIPAGNNRAIPEGIVQ